VGPRAGLDDVEKRKFFTLPGLELRSLGRPARSQSLYRLRYPMQIEEDILSTTSKAGDSDKAEKTGNWRTWSGVGHS
jgi:hypothetical protein